jgi:hypothetical protein
LRSAQIPTDLLVETVTSGLNEQRGSWVHPQGRFTARCGVRRDSISLPGPYNNEWDIPHVAGSAVITLELAYLLVWLASILARGPGPHHPRRVRRGRHPAVLWHRQALTIAACQPKTAPQSSISPEAIAPDSPVCPSTGRRLILRQSGHVNATFTRESERDLRKRRSPF